MLYRLLEMGWKMHRNHLLKREFKMVKICPVCHEQYPCKCERKNG